MTANYSIDLSTLISPNCNQYNKELRNSRFMV